MGRIIAFHDIAWKRGPDFDKTPINVPEFWDGIKGGYRHEESNSARPARTTA
jgi:hypothetical protein